MKRYSVWYLPIILLVVSSATIPATTSSPDGKPLLGVGDLDISKDAIAGVEKDALNGSGEAANRLSKYYAAIRLDVVQELYWARIAAENGSDPIFMYNYAVLLNSLPNVDKNERMRVRFWLKKAADGGFEDAKKALEKAPQTTK
jgi:TPR repeat protein